MRTATAVGLAAAALLILPAASGEARHGRGGHGGGRRAGGHSASHHHHRQRHHGFFGRPISISYLGYSGLYQPYRYRSRVYRDPRESNAELNIAVQTQLARRGYYRKEIDGVIGGDTRRAIRAFQRDQRWPENGWIDGRLLRQLRLI